MLEELRKLVKFSLGTWINFLMSMVFAPVSTFLIVPEEYGKYALFIVAQNFLVFAFGLGLQQSQIRYFHEKDPGQLLSGYMVTITLFFLAAVGIILGFREQLNFFVTGDTQASWQVGILLAGIAFLTTLNNLGFNHLRMKQEALQFSVIQIVTQLVNYAFFFAYVFFVKADFIAFLTASILSSVFQFIMIYFWYIRLGTLFSGFKWDKKLMRQSLLFGLPFVPAFMIDYLYTYSDRYLLRYFGDLASLGVYSIALRFSYAFIILQTGFHMYWAPYSMERFSKNPEDKIFYRDTFRIINFMLVLIVAGVMVGKDLIQYIIDDRFHGVIAYFPFLLFVPVYYTLSEITMVGINFSKKTNLHMIINAITFGINISLAFLLIPRLGPAGAAITCGLTYLALFSLRSYFGNRLYPQYLHWSGFIISQIVIISFVALDFIYHLSILIRIIACLTVMAMMWIHDRHLIMIYWNKLFAKPQSIQN